MDERQGWEPRQPENEPVSKYCSDANQYSDRGRVERMSHMLVGTRFNKRMIGANRQRRHPASWDGCSWLRRRGPDSTRYGGDGGDVEEFARGFVDDPFVPGADADGRSGCSA